MQSFNLKILTSDGVKFDGQAQLHFVEIQGMSQSLQDISTMLPLWA